MWSETEQWPEILDRRGAYPFLEVGILNTCHLADVELKNQVAGTPWSLLVGPEDPL